MSGVWLLMGLRRKGRTWMVYVPAPTITPWAPLAMPIDRPAEDAIDRDDERQPGVRPLPIAAWFDRAREDDR